ncbi:hypothetical protein DER29_3402 [Micromonospora sp. M71_S20]|uniref:hypothetical protein n=1 Tax=Micromonospora sp. M71_S20 TaxID=592872 RepID=UPI000F25EC57|nr:hypothetical protein [Micromonospora sp. M71_S20]RLK25400.1 hypothetical protein DER29_3402 [Micromonospora sp. M71_S20]
MYRFFTKHWEVTLVGSFNLTRPAHSGGGNVETGVLSEAPVDRRPRFWLEEIEEPPPFAQPVGEDDGVDHGFVPMLARFDWASGRAEVLWDGAGDSPRIEVYGRGVHLFEIGHLKPAVWTALSADDAVILRERLRETSFLTVVVGNQRGVVLVHETGMAHRPSILLDLTPADILRYWSMLTAGQRNVYLAQHGGALLGAGADLPVESVLVKPVDTIFDRFAGIFHGFASLGRAVRTALDEDRIEEARFRMFGAKYDSLPVLVQQVASDAAGDPLERYLMVLCAQQLTDDMRHSYPAFWESDPTGTSLLETTLAVRPALRELLVARNDAEMAEFLDWYEPRFLGKTTAVPA